MAINTAIITTPEAAVKAQAEAQRKRVAKALAKDGDSTGAHFALAEAADLDRAAAASLDPSNALRDRNRPEKARAKMRRAYPEPASTKAHPTKES